MHTLGNLIETHKVQVLDYLDRQVTVPVSTGLQRQGDVLIVPTAAPGGGETPVPPGGVPVVKGEAGGNTHTLVGDATCRQLEADPTDLTIATVTVRTEAYLAHPEHGYLGLGAGSYEVRRQRQQMDEIRMIAD